MEKRFKELGGKIYYNKGVDSIVLKNKKAEGIKLEDGTVVECDYVIPAVDSNLLFSRFIPNNIGGVLRV